MDEPPVRPHRPGDACPAIAGDPVGLRNLRDVGGAVAARGRRVPYGRLYRSEAPLRGDPDPALRPWPPRTVVDLRSPGEAIVGSHPLASSQTRIVNIPLLRGLAPGGEPGLRRSESRLSIGEIYGRLLQTSAANLVRVMETIVDGPGPVLLHCAAGKDRTGIAVAVALAAVDVEADSIVDDYVRTEEGLDGLLDRLRQGWAIEERAARLQWLTVERPDLMLAPVEAIRGVLESLGEWEGGAPGWLLSHGLSDAKLERLRAVLTQSVVT
jgi:protein-tyrosine phosphatase